MLRYQVIPVTSFQQNCSLIWCDQTNDAALIDPGGDIDHLLKAVADNHVDLTKIWLTHGHLDHVGATAELKERFNLPVTGPHIEDKFLLDAIPLQCEMFGFPSVEKFLPDQWIDEATVLSLGAETFSILYTPGHTPGHIVIKHDDRKLLWVGDVLFNGGIGRTDFPRGNREDLLASITNKLLILEDDYRFIPGHGPESTIGEERLHNPFLI